MEFFDGQFGLNILKMNIPHACRPQLSQSHTEVTARETAVNSGLNAFSGHPGLFAAGWNDEKFRFHFCVLLLLLEDLWKSQQPMTLTQRVVELRLIKSKAESSRSRVARLPDCSYFFSHLSSFFRTEMVAARGLELSCEEKPFN